MAAVPLRDVAGFAGEPGAERRRTVCYMCTTGYCATDVEVRDGKAVSVDIGAVPCPRGRAQLEFVYHPDRLLSPLRRVGERGSGAFEPISWDAALGDIAARLLDVRRRHGPQSVAFYVGYTKEPRPYVQRLAHAFGSPNYLTESSNCFLATSLAAAVTYGPTWRYFNYSGFLHPATRLHVLWGSNPPVSAPHTAEKLWEAQRRGTRIVAVDPRRTEAARRADLHLQLRPGTDGALALAMIHVLVAEQLYDREFVERWTVGFADLARLAQDFSPERAANITGVPAERIREAARLLATVKPAKLQLSANATVHAANGVQNHRAVILLPALTGNLDVPGGNMLVFDRPSPLKDISLKERLRDLAPRVGAAEFPLWERLTSEAQANALADQILTGKPYPIRALVGVGANLMIFANTRRAAEAWRQLDLVVLSDFFQTPTTRLADYVLPAATYMESPALLAGRPFSPQANLVKFREPVIAPRGESRPDWQIVFDLAQRLGLGELFWDGSFERCAEDVLAPSGISLAELRRHPEGMQLPLPPRQPKTYERTGFDTPSGKVEMRSSLLEASGYAGLPVYQEPPESPLSRPDLAREYPLVLTTGARVPMYTHSQFRQLPSLRRLMPEPVLEINAADALARGIAEGDRVAVSTPRGEIAVPARITEVVPPGVVQAGHGWSEANVNLLTDDGRADAISGYRSLKSLLCQVRKV